MSTLIKLLDYGQSYWLDNLTRHKIKGGELKKRVTKQGLRGITSNPAIFNKAISNSSDYDSQIKQLVKQELGVHEIYEELTIKDVQDACDVLRSVYDESDGVDGFISLEVSPYLARDTEGTMEEARRLYSKVNRPNVYIKIPGTDEGVPAIEQMLYEGININVTLLFSIQSYEAVAKAYINALKRRAAEGKSIKKVRSVASFFLSRIDVLTDEILSHYIVPGKTDGDAVRPEELYGKAAIASAKLAYRSFKKIFSGKRWQNLVQQGAKVQRPLWASTSTKDPLYRDVRYVETLIGPDTVNTLPDSTIDAFADHGILEENTIEKDVKEAAKVFDDLRKLGIDIDFITRQLVNEGIQKFISPYDNLMRSLSRKRAEFMKDKESSQTLNYGSFGSEVKEALGSLSQKQYGRRLFAKDPFLWKSDPDQVKEIRIRMDWLDSMEHFLSESDDINNFVKEVKAAKYKHVVLLGMGGSSLCPEVARETFGSKNGYPGLIVLDNTDPEAVKDVEKRIDVTKTLFIVSSKSGTTTETLSFYKYFYNLTEEAVGVNAGHHFAAITDPETNLVKEAEKKNFRKIFKNPIGFGGRYSALSFFGLVPMALIGIDIKKILQNAHQMQLGCGPFVPSEANPAVNLGTLLGIAQKTGRDKVTFVLSKSISAFGYWVEQLIAESTGKEGTGLIPVESEDLGKPDVYGNDRVFVYMHTSAEKETTIERKLTALEKAGNPTVRIEIKDKLALGAEFLRWEIATATAGKIIGINAFDQPNVEAAKKNTSKILNEWKQNGSLNEGEPLYTKDELTLYVDPDSKWLFEKPKRSFSDFLNAFVKLDNSPDYFALLAYFLETPGRNKTLQSIRMKIRNNRKSATTLGYGPRYLHSTGQLHKGGPNTGLFIILTADSEKDLPIAGEEYGFKTLHRSKALGDFRSLNEKDRRVIRINLGSNIEQGLKKLEQMIK